MTIKIEVDEDLAGWLLGHFRDGVGYSKSAYNAVAKAVYQQMKPSLLKELGITPRMLEKINL